MSETATKNGRRWGRRWWLMPVAVVLFFVISLSSWELLARSGLWPSYALPSFSESVGSLWENFANGRFQNAMAASLTRLIAGYLVATGIGLTMGLLMGRSRIANSTIGSLALGLQALPSVAWLPLALIWFGLEESAIIFVIVMGTVFSIAMSTASGIRNINPNLEKAARNMGAKSDDLLFDVILPASLPNMVSGMKQGWSFAWRSLIAAEMVYSTVGLGYMLQWGREFNNLPLVIAVMIVIVMIGLATDQFFFDPLEQAVHSRWGIIRRTRPSVWKRLISGRWGT
jgi:NitT/TauT family transport system permease protein